MSETLLRDYIDCGREIEFSYNGKMYSITYGKVNGTRVISFCEFYQEATDVFTLDELLEVQRDGVTVRQMISALTEEDIWLY